MVAVKGFRTESGAVYEFLYSAREDQWLVRRGNLDYEKRGDGTWLRLLNEPFVEVGYRAMLVVEPLDALGPDDVGNPKDSGAASTTRLTTIVAEVW